MKNMDKKVIEYIKMLGIDQIDAAASGHPGIVLGAAPIIYSIYANHLRIDKEFIGVNRDRFIMSAGHGSALLYSTLYTCGLLEMDDLKKFRKIGSLTPGHPEYGHTPYIDATTGPLGQGIATAVGMALANKIRGNDALVYVLCGDGDLMEGISYEALSFAGHMGLNNLIVLYDSNNISLDGHLSKTFSENIIDRFKSFGFNTFFVNDSNNIDLLNSKIEKAKKSLKPSLIEVKSIIGEGTSVAGSSVAHGKPLSIQDIETLRASFSIPTPFFEDLDIRKYMTDRLNSRMIEPIVISKENNFSLDVFHESGELRSLNGKVMEKISLLYNDFIGGSADLGSSTKTNVGSSFIHKDDFTGKNIYYGVREHAMAAITNGLALSGFTPYASTFLAFSDYMKPSIRLAALMNIPSIFIFSHDSINIGSDGPTHQPIEQLSMLRNIPNLNVIRPCDIKEILGAWKVILNSTRPTALVVSRDKTEMLDNTCESKVHLGAYIIREGNDGIIIATGSEVETANKIADDLFKERNINIRVVSMPSQNLFLEQSLEYRNMILPIEIKRVVIEAGSSSGWHRFVYSHRHLITIDSFGVSGTKDEVLDHMSFSYLKIKDRVNKLF